MKRFKLQNLIFAVTAFLSMAILSMVTTPAVADDNSVSGEIIDVSSSRDTITINSDGDIDTYVVDADTLYTFEVGSGDGLQDLSRGDRVVLELEEMADGRKRTRSLQSQGRSEELQTALAQITTDDEKPMMRSTLPQTASADYNLLLLGIVLLLCGISLQMTGRSAQREVAKRRGRDWR